MRLEWTFVVILQIAVICCVIIQVQRPGGEWVEFHRFDGINYFDGMGYAISGISDLDDDIVPDLVVSSLFSSQGAPFAGAVHIFSGSSGAPIYEFQGQIDSGGFGQSVGVADVNNDGSDDILVGAPQEDPNGLIDSGSVYVFSGSDGTELIRLDGIKSGELLGYNVVGLYDLDLDGHQDFLVRSPGRGTFGSTFDSALIYSGRTLSIMFEIGGAWQGTGGAAAPLNDVNHDGHPDMAISDAQQGGCVSVYSGQDGNEIYRLNGYHPFDDFGTSIANIGDVDNDHIDDFIVGAPERSTSKGSAYVFSGSTGKLLEEFSGSTVGDAFGASVANARDVDGDGFNDVLIGAQFHDEGALVNVGAIFTYSTFDGRLLSKILGDAQELSGFGSTLAAVEDLNGDDLGDFIVGIPAASVNGVLVGSALVYVLDSFLTADEKKVFSSIGSQITFQLDFPDSEAQKTYQLLTSISQPGRSGPNFDVPLARSPALAKTIQNSLPIFSAPTGTLDVNGDATVLMTLVPGEASAAVGRTFRFSAIVYETPTALRQTSATVDIEVVP